MPSAAPELRPRELTAEQRARVRAWMYEPSDSSDLVVGCDETLWFLEIVGADVTFEGFSPADVVGKLLRALQEC